VNGTAFGQRARVGYDPAELCRCIVVCFSTGDLRQVAESLGAAEGINWSRGTNEAARDLVRHFERKADLDTLVAKLREVRPLVEWPEPALPDAPAAPPSEPLANPGALSLGAPTAANPGDTAIAEPLANAGDIPAGALPSAETDAGAPPPPPPPAPLPPPPAPPAATITDTSESASRSVRGAPPPASSSFAWPGTVGGGAGAEQPAASRGIDPKILVIVSGLTLLAALIAFIAGRSGASPAAPSPDPAGSASPNAAAGGDPEGPAARLSDSITRSFANVARACEIPSRGALAEDILLRAFDQCGPQQAPVRPAAEPLPPDPTSPRFGGAGAGNDDGAAAPRPAAPRPAAPKAGGLPADNGPGSECMRGCDGEHRTCKDRCGKEPTQSTQYAEYQGCLSRCLSAASKCRLGCK
jgi:hypothetical protein